MLEQLVHNGVIVPEPPVAPGLSITVRGRRIALTPEQEEMALAWAKKKDTDYVKDPVFVENFMQDFSEALGIEPRLELDEVDFSAYHDLVDAERQQRDAMSKEERKALAEQRRLQREALKERYGYAIVNGQRVELGTYMVEPSGIFMGRGQHPLRGRWKQGASQQDITLNYGPDPDGMQGDWDEVVWQPESMWVARWKDKLSGKLKYVWLSDTAPIKQRREAKKFDQALRLDESLEEVREAIARGLVSENARTRMVATVCFLIDRLVLRVGDEKEADEADTVGATTLRPEHVTLYEDGSIEFSFLGKDSVEWHRTLSLPSEVYDSLADLIAQARPSSESADSEEDHVSRCLPQLFPDTSSRDVNAFLSDIMPGLSAKMFRTYHATKVVEKSLQESGVKPEHPEHRKWQAASLANLEAAHLCNHTKQARGNWERSRDRYHERIERGQERVSKYEEQVETYQARYEALREEAAEKEAAASSADARAKVRARYKKRFATARRRIEGAMGRRERAKEALGKVKAQFAIAKRKREWNLTTSLKSYVDPRVYYRWAEAVDYDVLNKYYTAALRRKYAWVQHIALDETADTFEIRPCMEDDLDDVIELMREVQSATECAVVPLDRAAIAERFLPDLEKPWREAVIALDSHDEIVAFAALGPVRDVDGEPLVDCFAALDPDWIDEEAAKALAAEMLRRYERFTVLHPRKRSEEPYRLAPEDTCWYAYAPGVAEELGLEPERQREDETDLQSELSAELESAAGS